MKPAPFDYFAPRSLDEALMFMANNGYDAKLLAGGQSLIPAMNFRLAQPAIIVDLNGLDELEDLHAEHNGRVHIGAMVRQSRVESAPMIARLAPLLHETMPFVAHSQIRNRGTLGGSLAHADPAAELPVVCVALRARFRLRRQDSERVVEAQEFYRSLFETVLEPEEILVDISLPPFPERTGFAFCEMARRHGDYALAGAAAVVTLDAEGVCQSARLVFLNVGEKPMVADKAGQLLIGEEPAPDLIQAACELACKNEIDPTGDIHASMAYKRHVANVLARRALSKAIERASHGLDI